MRRSASPEHRHRFRRELTPLSREKRLEKRRRFPGREGDSANYFPQSLHRTIGPSFKQADATCRRKRSVLRSEDACEEEGEKKDAHRNGLRGALKPLPEEDGKGQDGQQKGG